MPPSRTPCVPAVRTNGAGKPRRDSPYEACDDFCSATFAKSHCTFCKCKSCSFCHAISNGTARAQQALLAQAERRARGRELSASWCEEALMRRPTHLFRRMWAAASWAPMQPGAPACWERRRDAPHRRLKPVQYFQETANGTHCATNWYEGHAGPLGEAGHLPRFAQPAPALLGYDDGIFEKCAAALPPGTPACRRDKPSHVAKCCMAAGFNILNMVGHRVPYNLCRNLEWQMCAVSGKLPSQPVGDRSIRFANAPRQLDVEPLARIASRRRGQSGEARRTRNCSPESVTSDGKKRLGYSLPDIFHLEVCLFNQVCTNGAALFDLAVGEPFVCDFSPQRFAALAETLLGTPPEARYSGCSA